VSVDEIGDRFCGLLELLLAELVPAKTEGQVEENSPAKTEGQVAGNFPAKTEGRQVEVQDGRVLVSAAVLPVLTILSRLQRGQPGSSIQASCFGNSLVSKV
jgi:hypothetical protein